MEEKKSKKSLLYAIIIILVLMLIYALFQISALKSEIEIVKNGYSAEISNVRSEINTIYNNVDEQLKKEASLLSYLSYSYGDINVSNHTVLLTVEVVPKEITEDMQMELRVGDEGTYFEQNGESFKATIPAYLFVDADAPLILTIKTNEEIKTEFLQDIVVSHLWSNFLPHIQSDMMASSHFDKNGITVNLDTMIEFYGMDENSGIIFEKFMLVTEVNGVEIAERDITPEAQGANKFGEGMFTLTCEETFDISEEDELIMYIVGVDSLGYVHKYPLHHRYDTENGHADIYYEETIYDSNGNILYKEGM